MIFDTIVKRRYPRTILILPTQYGKSLAVADGVLMRAGTFNEPWAIIAPTESKARIIMDYIIDHIFDDDYFLSQLDYFGTKEQLKRERSKTRITFRAGGEVRVYTGNAQNSQAVKKSLMGFGAPNVVLDESGMLPDDLYATVKRMLGGTKDNFLLEIGNPAFNNHFRRTWFGSRYKKIFVDAETALAEGRYTREYLDEMKEEPGYDWMYNCLFPDEAEILPNGYRKLLNDIIIQEAMLDDIPEIHRDANGVILDKPVLGIDVAGGGKNFTKFVVRYPKYNFAMVAQTSDSDDLDEIADIAEQVIKDHQITDYRIAVDAGGVGHGLAPLLKNRGLLIKPVLFGESAPDKAFLNRRAWMYWQVRKWLKAEGGKLVRDDGFLELGLINYKQSSTDKIQIEPKEEMIKRKALAGEKVESPDTADALALTFVDTSTIVEDDDIYVE